MRFNNSLAVSKIVCWLSAGGDVLTWAAMTSLVHFWAYRLGSYVLVNMVDDPALLALVFC